MNSITADWANQTGSRIQQLLLAFDRRFPGRIAGVAPSQLHTSEWIQIALDEFGWVPDYSQARRSAFCAWKGKPAGCQQSSQPGGQPSAERQTCVFAWS